MQQEFKRVFKHSVIYGIGSVVSKIGGFVLIPVYTRYLAPAQYGMLELFYVTSSVLAVFLGAGISHATLRFFFEYEHEDDRRSVVGSALVGMATIGGIFLILLFTLSGRFSQYLLKTPEHAFLFKLVFMMLWLNISMDISAAYIRAKEMSKFYVGVSTVQLVVRLGLNLYFVISLGMGLKGILLGDLVSTFLAWILLTSVTARFSRLRFAWGKLKELYLYSYPILLGSIGSMIVGNSDRFFINAFRNLGAVGLFGLAARFASVLGSLYGEPFRQSYGPYRFSIMKREDAKGIYSRMLTYFLYGAIFFGLLMAVTAREVIQIVAAPPFWGAHKVVPLILLSSILSQCYYLFQIGIYLQKRTSSVSWILTVVAVLNLAFMILLIPDFGMYGAALAGLLSNLGLCLISWIVSQKLYPIHYEWSRIAQMGGVAGGLYLLASIIHLDNVYLALAAKGGLILLFPALLYPMGFYHEEELHLLRRGLEKVRLRVFGNPESTRA